MARTKVTPSFPVRAVKQALRDEDLDGWLFYFFQGNDPLALRLLKISPDAFFTRRWFYFVPAQGEPLKVVHRIEPEALRALRGQTLTYSSWPELHTQLRRALENTRRVAMQYSPKNAVPTLSRVDAGTVELVRSFGVQVVSSGDLIQRFDAVLTPHQRQQHFRTARELHALVQETFAFLSRSVRARRKTSEFDVQKFILRGYARRGWITNANPIVAVNQNSALPHYTPTRLTHQPVKRGDWVLLDVWAKPPGVDTIYADITWCGYVGNHVPTHYADTFQWVCRARDAAVDFIAQRGRAQRPVKGWEVDQAARRVIERAGYGPRFIHRTGHSIGTEDHAQGANMDGLETKETRRLLPGTLFSIEPGIYLKEFGARSEINLYMEGSQPVVTGGPRQAHVIKIG